MAHENKSDLYLSIVLIIVSIYVFYQSLNMPIESGRFPIIISIPLFAFSVILLIHSIRHKKDEKDKSKSKQTTNSRNISLALLYMVCSVLLMEYIGYFIAAVLLFISIFLTLGYRRIKLGALMSIIIVSVIFVIFKVILNVPLPGGILISIYYS